MSHICRRMFALSGCGRADGRLMRYYRAEGAASLTARHSAIATRALLRLQLYMDGPLAD